MDALGAADLASRHRGPLGRWPTSGSATSAVVVLAVATVTAAAAVFTDLAPTASRADLVLVPVGVIGVISATAWAPAWLLTLWAGSLAAFSLSRPLLAIGMTAVAVVPLSRRADRPAIRAGLAALAVLGSTALPELWRFGTSSLVGVGGGVIILLWSLVHAPRRVRRPAVLLLVPLVLWLVAASVATGAAFIRARADLTLAENQLRNATAALKDGDVGSARVAMSEARVASSSAVKLLDGRLGELGVAVPVVAQHRRAAIAMSTSASELVAAADRSLSAAPRSRLTGRSGRFDVDGIAALAGYVGELGDAADDAIATAEQIDSDWLLPEFSRRLTGLTGELTERRDDLARLEDVVAIAPGLLGADGPRRYLILFLTPSEARPLGGFMGSYATLLADDGLLTLEQVGRAGTLTDYVSVRPQARILSGPPEYLDRYGPFGAGDTETPASRFWWQRFTISPDFPSVAQVAAELFPRSGGPAVDGVVAIDPHGLAGLLRITGPIELPSIGRTIDASTAEQFLAREQYLLIPERGNDARIELLGEAAEATFDALLSTEQLDLGTLLDAVEPEVRGRHLMVWSGDADEQHLFATSGVDGAFALAAQPAPSDALAVVNTNSSGNKIDVFLEREVHYDAVFDQASGELDATVTVTLHNGAPAEGLPDYVLGNAVGDQQGSNRTYLTVYSPHEFIGARADGIEIEPARGVELGWQYAEWRVTIPAGETVRLEYRLRGTLPPGAPYELFVRPQPAALADTFEITVADPGGGVIVSWASTVTENQTLRPS